MKWSPLPVYSSFVFYLNFLLQLCPLSDTATLCHFGKLVLE